MSRNEHLRHEMLLRVRDFGVAHRDEFPKSSPAGKEFATVAAAAAEMQAGARRKLLAAEEDRKAKTEVREAITERLMTLARTARLAARTTPGADRGLKLPSGKSDAALLTTTLVFIEKAEAVLNVLVLLGLPKTFLTELQELADRLQVLIDATRNGKSGLAAAQLAIREAMTQGLEAVRALDVIVTNTLRENKAQVAAWKLARRVSPKGKGSRPSDNPTPSPAPAPTPAPTPAPSPVAVDPSPVPATDDVKKAS